MIQTKACQVAAYAMGNCFDTGFWGISWILVLAKTWCFVVLCGYFFYSTAYFGLFDVD